MKTKTKKSTPSKPSASTEKPVLKRSSNVATNTNANTQQHNGTGTAQRGANLNAAAAMANYNYNQYWQMLSNQYYANSLYNGYNPGYYNPIWSSSAGGFYNRAANMTNPASANAQAFVTPTKSESSGVALKNPSQKQSSTASAIKEDTTVFDENSELKNRVLELEAELGLSSKPCKGKKVSNENVKPDPCASTSTPIKKEQETLLLSPIKDLNKHDRKWIEKYDELVAYQKTHGHNMVPAAFKPLGPWVSRQRQEYKKGKLSKERTELLEEIDFVWVAA